MGAPLGKLDSFPRAALGHLPTPLEALPNLSADVGRQLFVKRDDCSGLALGGNKVRQLEFYLGEALAQKADTVLITGAVQSNFVRLAAAAACKLGLACEVQLEERVPGKGETYRRSGNVLLDQLLGAKIHHYPVGADLVLAFRIVMDLGAQQLVEQHIAGLPVALALAGHAIFQLDLAGQAQLAGRRRGQAHEIGLHSPGDQDRVGLLCLRLAQIVLELANFVAAQGQAAAVVALDEELPSEVGAEVGQRF